ncbi:MAG: hypothetical protein ACQERO_14270, partial [Bacteroidota bacterium]
FEQTCHVWFHPEFKTLSGTSPDSVSAHCQVLFTFPHGLCQESGNAPDTLAGPWINSGSPVLQFNNLNDSTVSPSTLPGTSLRSAR